MSGSCNRISHEVWHDLNQRQPLLMIKFESNAAHVGDSVRLQDLCFVFWRSRC